MTDLRPVIAALFLIYASMVVIYIVVRWTMAGTGRGSGRRFILLMMPAFMIDNLVTAWQHPPPNFPLWVLHAGAFVGMVVVFWRFATLPAYRDR